MQHARRELATLITHPVRSRILAALMGRQLTTQQLGELLPDVPTPSLYRHLRILAEAEILTTVEEVRVNGAATRVYAVNPQRNHFSAEDVEDATKADQLRYFTTFLDMLIDRFRNYLEHVESEHAMKDQPHHALMAPLNLNPDEYARFMKGLNTFLKPWCALPPDAERQRVIFAHIALPDRADPPRE